jgi:lysophospholipase L1-like esterase
MVIAGLSGPPGGLSALRSVALGCGIASMAIAWAPLALVRISLTLGVALVIGCGLLELGLQAFGSPPTPTLCKLDDTCLYRLQPGASKVHRLHALDGGAVIEVQVNQDGYRGAPLLPDGAARRVLVCGDSFVEADGAPLEQTFVERLEARLAEGLGAEVECINAGVNGYGPDQALLRLDADLDALAPDLVVLSIFAGNDFGDIIRNRLLALDDDGNLRACARQLSRDAQLQIEGRSTLILPRLLRKGLERAPAQLMSLFADDDTTKKAKWRVRWEPLLAQQYRDYDRSVVRDDPIVVNLLHDYYDLDVSLDPAGPSATYKRAAMSAVIARFAEVCRERGLELVVVVVPSPIDMSDDWGFRVRARELHPAYEPTAATDAVAAGARAASVPVVDLFGPFDELGGETVFHRFDDHWNPTGQDLAAELVARLVVEQGLL